MIRERFLYNTIRNPLVILNYDLDWDISTEIGSKQSINCLYFLQIFYKFFTEILQTVLFAREIMALTWPFTGPLTALSLVSNASGDPS